jgi:hypothetical protein
VNWDCDCKHQRANHCDREGNKVWRAGIVEYNKGVGACFAIGCECKQFGSFDLTVFEIRRKKKLDIQTKKSIVKE